MFMKAAIPYKAYFYYELRWLRIWPSATLFLTTNENHNRQQNPSINRWFNNNKNGGEAAPTEIIFVNEMFEISYYVVVNSRVGAICTPWAVKYCENRLGLLFMGKIWWELQKWDTGIIFIPDSALYIGHATASVFGCFWIKYVRSGPPKIYSN